MTILAVEAEVTGQDREDWRPALGGKLGGSGMGYGLFLNLNAGEGYGLWRCFGLSRVVELDGDGRRIIPGRVQRLCGSGTEPRRDGDA